MRQSVLIAAGVCLLLAASAGAEEQRSGGMLEPEDFAILPWSGAPGDPRVLEEIKACGFNRAGFVRPEDLDLVAKAGLKCIVSEGSTHVGDAEAGLDEKEVTRRVEALVKRVGQHPAVYGYYLRDEPSARAYAGLGRWAAAFAKAAPKAMPYINLFPNYASPEQMAVPTYDQYVEDFVNTVKPRFISYDHYALMDDGTLRHGYFQNLEVVRKAALRHNLPFWNIVLSNAHFHYAQPTDGGLRFQAYTTLAYGARGISYFTYFAPEVGNYRLAPIDQFGNKTATWEMLRSVNLQIQRLGPTYVKLKSVNVFHHPNVPEGCSDLKTSRFLAEVSGRDLMVGEFDGPEGRPYVMVVNKDLHRSTPFGVRFKDAGPTMMVSAYTGQAGGWGGENSWLAPGQGMLLFLGK